METSPMEELFFEQLKELCADGIVEVTDHILKAVVPGDQEVLFAVIRQAEVGPYRADFGLMAILGTLQKQIAVEIDGHDFHEKTKSQVARDKKRDRYFASRGLVVLRFSGSEVYADVRACVVEAMTHLQHLEPKEMTGKEGAY